MNPVLSMLLNKAMQGQLANHPLMAQVNQMMAGKTPEQQRQTVINAAQRNLIKRKTVFYETHS